MFIQLLKVACFLPFFHYYSFLELSLERLYYTIQRFEDGVGEEYLSYYMV